MLREMRRWLWCPQWGFCQSDEKTETSLLKKHGELVFCFATAKMWHLKRQSKISNYQQRDCLSTRVATHSQIRIARRMNTLSDVCATGFGSEAGRGTHKHAYTQKKNNVKSRKQRVCIQTYCEKQTGGYSGKLGRCCAASGAADPVPELELDLAIVGAARCGRAFQSLEYPVNYTQDVFSWFFAKTSC